MIQTISLTLAKSGDSRRAVVAEIVVQDERTCEDIARVKLDEHQLALLLSGSVVRVDVEENDVVVQAAAYRALLGQEA